MYMYGMHNLIQACAYRLAKKHTCMMPTVQYMYMQSAYSGMLF